MREEIIGDCRLILGDCRDILPTLGPVDAVVTDPPYGMGKGDWDQEIPEWLPLVGAAPVAAFSGVVGMRDYPVADWTGAWVRPASTQRIGRLGGFNNWEPILFYNLPALSNDVIVCPNIHEDTGHPTTKPTRLMLTLVGRMPGRTILDPFMGSGTTGVACALTDRAFIGVEREPLYFDIACRRIEEAYKQPRLFAEPVQKSVQDVLI
jgi:DNA modification methylase